MMRSKLKTNNFIERSIMGALSFLKDSLFADEYASKTGFLQALDARIKTLSILLLLCLVLFAKSIFFLFCVYFLSLVLAGVSSIRLGFFLKRTWFFIPLFSLCIVIPALFNMFSPGQSLVSLRWFGSIISITRQGVSSAAIFFMRVLTSVSLCVLLALTTRHYVLLKVLRIFKVPQVFVMTMGMCYRYVYLFIEIIQNTYTAIKSRTGYVFSAKRGQSVVTSNIAALWQRSYQMHNEVYQAMLSRGYAGEPRILDEFCPGDKDWLWLAGILVFFIVGIWSNYCLN